MEIENDLEEKEGRLVVMRSEQQRTTSMSFICRVHKRADPNLRLTPDDTG